MWRYSRIDRFDLGRYRPVSPDGTPSAPPASARVHALVAGLGATAALVVTVDGVLATVAGADDRLLTVGRVTEAADGAALLGGVLGDATDFPLLNDGFAPDPVAVVVRPGVSVADPVVVVHLVTGGDGTAVLPRTVVRLGDGATASVVELVLGADAPLLAGPAVAVRPGVPPADHLVVPVTELRLGDDAGLDYVSVQALGRGAWQVAHHASAIGARATLRSFAVAAGGGYARLRTDSSLDGTGGRSELRAAFVGRDDQMLDFRTLQDHAAPRTASDLLFMGAVAERSHSVYSGLIRIRRGAVRSDARQTNHNLVLDEGAHADSVPNLDIQENDVQCSHGSTVGPVDEDQRYYLESRGVTPERAGQLIVGGFFRHIAGQVPVAAVGPLVADTLAARIGGVGG